MPDVLLVEIEKVSSGPYAQRIEVDDERMADLARSIQRIGVISPLVVLEEGDGFVVVAGHRRLAACKMVGVDKVPVVVGAAAEGSAAEICFAENFFRKDLSPVELACGIRDALDKGLMEMEELAGALRRTERWVKEQLSLLDWPSDVLACVHEGWMSVAAARPLAEVDDDTYREFLLGHARESGVTARSAAAWLQAWRSMQPAQEAVVSEPGEAPSRSHVAVPQAPCICCGAVFRTDELSHVPACPGCIRVIREAGAGVG